MINFLNLFSKKVKKKKTMDINQETLDAVAEKYSGMEFQWIKGDDMSVTESYKGVHSNGDDIFILFDSGKRINTSLLDEYMVWFPASTRIPDNPQISAPLITTPIKSASAQMVTSIQYSDQSNISLDESPIYKLLKKQKKNTVEVSIKLKLNLPSKELYNVLCLSFDDAEKEIVDFVLDDVDIDDIKRSLGESIRKSYYTGSVKVNDTAKEPIAANRRRNNSTNEK
jgi:hypothetical protein